MTEEIPNTNNFTSVALAVEAAEDPEPEIVEQPRNGNQNIEDEVRENNITFHRALSLLASPIVDESGSPQQVFYGLLTLFVVGATIGLLTPKNPALTPIWRYISAAIGYIYFLCWSVSFYPQVISNFKRKTTQGLSADFCGLNVLGFACYASYNTAFFFSTTIQRLYKERYGEYAEITVQSNDVAFAVHAFILSSVTFLQIGYYDGVRAQIPSLFILAFMVVVGLLISTFPIIVVYYPFFDENWLDYLYILSYIKVSISLIKYIPQMILNYTRRSTVGWSIWNIILDLTGGCLSDLQLILDCADMNDFSGITGNLAKVGLLLIEVHYENMRLSI